MVSMMDDSTRSRLLKSLIDEHMGDAGGRASPPLRREDTQGRRSGIAEAIQGEDPDGTAEDDGMGGYPAPPGMDQASVQRPMPRTPNASNPRGNVNVNAVKPPENEAEDDPEMDGEAPYANEPARGGQDMVMVPRALAMSVMDKLMASGSRNAISKSAPEDDVDDGGNASVNAVAPLKEQYNDPRRKQINKAMNQRDG